MISSPVLKKSFLSIFLCAASAFADSPTAAPPVEKLRIYQLLPRIFGNTNEARKPNGSIEENGSG